MKNKDKKYLIYLVAQVCLFIALAVFQMIAIIKGKLVFDRAFELFPVIGGIQILLTAVSFIFSVIIFLLKRKEGMTLFDLFPIYFLFALVADVFFSATKFSIVGHICFLICYLVFMVMRKSKFYEYIGIDIIGIIAAIVLIIAKKYSVQMNVDIVLGALLILNCAMMWIKFAKSKDKSLLYLSIGVSLIFISDLTIGLRTALPNSLIGGNVIGLLTWPTYLIGNALFLYYYANFSRQESVTNN